MCPRFRREMANCAAFAFLMCFVFFFTANYAPSDPPPQVDCDKCTCQLVKAWWLTLPDEARQLYFEDPNTGMGGNVKTAKKDIYGVPPCTGTKDPELDPNSKDYPVNVCGYYFLCKNTSKKTGGGGDYQEVDPNSPGFQKRDAGTLLFEKKQICPK